MPLPGDAAGASRAAPELDQVLVTAKPQGEQPCNEGLIQLGNQFEAFSKKAADTSGKLIAGGLTTTFAGIASGQPEILAVGLAITVTGGAGGITAGGAQIVGGVLQGLGGAGYSNAINGLRFEQCMRDNMKYVSLAAGAAQGAVTGYVVTGNPIGALAGGVLGGGAGYLISGIDSDPANQTAGRAEIGGTAAGLRVVATRALGAAGGSVLGGFTGGFAGGAATVALGPELGATVGGMIGGANSSAILGTSTALGAYRGGIAGIAGVLAGNFVRNLGTAILSDICSQ